MTQHIKDLVSVTGPVLVLISFFTTQRSTELRAMLEVDTPARDFTREALLSSVLPLVTVGLIGVYLGTFIDVVKVTFGDGTTTSFTYAVLLVMLLLVALLAYQLSIAKQAWDARRESRTGLEQAN